MRQALAPMLFDEDHPAAAEAARPSVVAPARRSPQAQRKTTTKLAADDTPLHSFHTLLSDLATVAKNRILPSSKDAVPLDLITTPTPLQALPRGSMKRTNLLATGKDLSLSGSSRMNRTAPAG